VKGLFCKVVQPEGTGNSVRWCSQKERRILQWWSHSEGGAARGNGGFGTSLLNGAARGNEGFCITHWCGQREGGIVHPTVVHLWGGGFCTSLWCSQRSREILHTSVVQLEETGDCASHIVVA
jgi:hypothetical protein